jgi:hypothetical protein
MKMYFVVKEDVPLGLAMVGVAHGAMMAEMRWGCNGCPDTLQDKYNTVYKDWQDKSFRKVVVRATEKQFDDLICNNQRPRLVVTESSLGDKPTVLVFLPIGDEDNTLLRCLPLYNQEPKDQVQEIQKKVSKLKQEAFCSAFRVAEGCLMQEYSEGLQKAFTYTDWRKRESKVAECNQWMERNKAVLRNLEMCAIKAYQEYDMGSREEDFNGGTI